MSSPPTVKELAKQLAHMNVAPVSPVQSPGRARASSGGSLPTLLLPPRSKEKERTVDETIKSLSPPQPLRGNETLEELQKLSAFYTECQGKVSVKLERESKDTLKWRDYQASLEERLKQLRLLEQSRRLMAEVDLVLKKDEVEMLVARINDATAERKQALDRLKDDIAHLITSNPAIDVATCLEEMLRTASSTSIQEGDAFVQTIPENYDDRFAKVDVDDISARFRRLFVLFQKYAGDTTPIPEMKGWTAVECKKWAETQKNFNEVMSRLIRSCSQALFTGSLLKKDLFMHAQDPTFAETLNKLYASLPAGAQQIYRQFDKDGVYSIMLILPILMKTQEKATSARFTIEYCIKFDKTMSVTSLHSRASRPIY